MDQATFTCATCHTPFTVDERQRGQTVQCQRCGALCELPRLVAAAPPPRQTEEQERLLRGMIDHQAETNRQLWWIGSWSLVTVILLAILIAILLCGGLTVKLAR